MKKNLFLITLIIVNILTFSTKTILSQSEDKEPIALLELYTSEGCSSCPPAERLLNDISKKAKDRNLKVFSLAFHVDYWNYLGWEDRFSNPAYTERQRAYGRQFNIKSIYTPQLVINGNTHVVGSDKDKVAEEIEKALKVKAKSSITLLSKKIKSRQYEIYYNIKGKYKNQWLQTALIEDGLKSNVNAGENDGEKLYHDNIVRSFISKTLTKAEGKIEINIKRGININNASVITFIQNPETLDIYGADYVNLVSKENSLIKFK